MRPDGGDHRLDRLLGGGEGLLPRDPDGRGQEGHVRKSNRSSKAATIATPRCRRRPSLSETDGIMILLLIRPFSGYRPEFTFSRGRAAPPARGPAPPPRPPAGTSPPRPRTGQPGAAPTCADGFHGPVDCSTPPRSRFVPTGRRRCAAFAAPPSGAQAGEQRPGGGTAGRLGAWMAGRPPRARFDRGDP